uniref:Uncharacterized protein n=1 Tax=Anguilla anguilla TaxID=7936 RepID=A0A0E9Q9Y9_ANGAN
MKGFLMKPIQNMRRRSTIIMFCTANEGSASNSIIKL